MNKITALIIGGLCTLLGFALYWHAPKVLALFPKLPVSTQLPRGAIVVWNKTDKEIEITARPHVGKYHKIELPPTSRGYMVLADAQDTSALPIKYLTVRYKGKRFKFTEDGVLNSCPGSGTNSIPHTRYFAVMMIDREDSRWLGFKKRLADDQMELDEKCNYLILSNHCKLGSAEDVKARLAIKRLGRI